MDRASWVEISFNYLQEFGVTEVRDLIPNGREVLVTDVNKADYIRYFILEAINYYYYF